MRVAMSTLGCKVNQYESQAMAALLISRGHTIVPEDAGADVYIVNSCTVTADSDRKSRQLVRRAQRRGDGIVALCGCFSQVSPEEAATLGVDLLCGNSGHAAFVEQMEALWEGQAATLQPDEASRRTTFEFLPAGGLPGRTRALLKVEDGCDNHCTYCIIPTARGPVRSLARSKAREEAARLSSLGYREIVLTGIELSSWGRDLPEETGGLIHLIEDVAKAAGAARLRLGSLEPRTVTEDFARRIAAIRNLCPHIHLSLQSGCDATLRRMGRRYRTADYLAALARLRRHLPGLAVTTDLIVGFPGESEEAFAETLHFVRQCAFSSMHIFPYSIRKGTPAAAMNEQCNKVEKQQRAAAARALGEEMERLYLESLVGPRCHVQMEDETDRVWQGHAEHYVIL